MKITTTPFEAMCFDDINLSSSNLTEPALPDFTVPAEVCLPTPKKEVTLVLDLDETLIHTSMFARDDADFSFPMSHGSKDYTMSVKKRPHVDTFLQKVSKMFKVVIFTASSSSYANRLLDKLDPENTLISQRFFRDSCVRQYLDYIKDLTIVVDDLAKVVIIDNSPEVFRLQKENGIPIKTWIDDPNDNSLLDLIPFLEVLAVADDVRPIIAEKLCS
uniref:FCP1 homology domain-containing protein n=1 Tax=Leersia perrieri TaxID=77586 RepID=A0A0D9WJT5_9ORYZ